MSKKGYIFRLDWSQTEHEMIVVYARSREEAETYARRNDARYVHFYGMVDRLIEV